MTTPSEDPQSLDWRELARELGAVSYCSTYEARAAVQRMLGPTKIVAAVHAAVAYDEGWLLANHALRLIRPRVAMQECWRIFRESDDQETRYAALILLSDIGDHSILAWLPRLLDDSDVEVVIRAANILPKLYLDREVEWAAIANFVDLCEKHADSRVREIAERMRELHHQEEGLP